MRLGIKPAAAVSLAVLTAIAAIVLIAVRPIRPTSEEARAMKIDAAYTESNSAMTRAKAQAENERESKR